MKQLITTLSIIAIAATTVKAQKTKTKKAYVRVGVGYAFPHAGDTYIKNRSVSFISATNETKKYSLGAGANATVAGGYWFTKHIGAELGVNVGIAPRKFETEYSDPSTSLVIYKRYAKMPVYLIPALVLQTGGENINLYTRLGLTVNVAGKVIEEVKETMSSYKKLEGSFKTGVGFQGALGVSIPAGKSINVFIEANGIAMNQYLKKAEVIEATESGINILPIMTTSDKVVEYDNTVTVTATPDPGKSTKATTFSMPFSNVGFSAGVAFVF